MDNTDGTVAIRYAADQYPQGQKVMYIIKVPAQGRIPVSYTHLTLPTNREV